MIWRSAALPGQFTVTLEAKELNKRITADFRDLCLGSGLLRLFSEHCLRGQGFFLCTCPKSVLWVKARGAKTIEILYKNTHEASAQHSNKYHGRKRHLVRPFPTFGRPAAEISECVWFEKKKGGSWPNATTLHTLKRQHYKRRQTELTRKMFVATGRSKHSLSLLQ